MQANYWKNINAARGFAPAVLPHNINQFELLGDANFVPILGDALDGDEGKCCFFTFFLKTTWYQIFISQNYTPIKHTNLKQ